jgi:hypothetical protein
MGISEVKNSASWGLYVWELDNGKVFGDEDGNVLNIPGKPFDIVTMNKITQAAQHYGAPHGKAKFIPGIQRVSEARHSEERDRMRQGLIPSETDIGMWKEEQENYEEYQRRGWDWDG